MAIAAPPAAPWLALPVIAGANVYWTPPGGALIVPAVVYRPDEPWIDRQPTYRTWLEHYVAVCVVAYGGPDAVTKLYELAAAIREAIAADPDLAGWKWEGAGGIVETEQAGLRYLASAVRLSFSAEY